MKAATEEVNKVLENAGQKLSNSIYLNQMQLNDLPVLGVLAMLHFIYCVMLVTIMVNMNYVLTEFQTLSYVFPIICLF